MKLGERSSIGKPFVLFRDLHVTLISPKPSQALLISTTLSFLYCTRSSLSRHRMSKNTRTDDFRKVDVDELDEENFRDEDTQDESGDTDTVSQRESEIKSLVSSYPQPLIIILAHTSTPIARLLHAVCASNNLLVHVRSQYSNK